MVSLSFQKRLAASVLGCGQKRVRITSITHFLPPHDYYIRVVVLRSASGVRMRQ